MPSTTDPTTKGQEIKNLTGSPVGVKKTTPIPPNAKGYEGFAVMPENFEREQSLGAGSKTEVPAGIKESLRDINLDPTTPKAMSGKGEVYFHTPETNFLTDNPYLNQTAETVTYKVGQAIDAIGGTVGDGLTSVVDLIKDIGGIGGQKDTTANQQANQQKPEESRAKIEERLFQQRKFLEEIQKMPVHKLENAPVGDQVVSGERLTDILGFGSLSLEAITNPDGKLDAHLLKDAEKGLNKPSEAELKARKSATLAVATGKSGGSKFDANTEKIFENSNTSMSSLSAG